MGAAAPSPMDQARGADEMRVMSVSARFAPNVSGLPGGGNIANILCLLKALRSGLIPVRERASNTMECSVQGGMLNLPPGTHRPSTSLILQPTGANI